MPETLAIAAPPVQPVLDIREIRRLLPHRYPMLLVDRVESLEPGVSAQAIKCVTANDPFLVGHFPDFPVMPGVLIVDALAQTAGIMLRSGPADRPAAAPSSPAGRPGMLAGIPRMRFFHPVVPGDRLVMRVRLIKSFGSTHRVSAEAEVDGRQVVAGELDLAS